MHWKWDHSDVQVPAIGIMILKSQTELSLGFGST